MPSVDCYLCLGLYSYARDLMNGRLDMGPKRLIIQAHIISRLKWGMEIWYPNTRTAKDSFCKAEAVLVSALHCALGLDHTRRNLLFTRLLKADVLRADLTIPSLATENDAACLRNALKHDPSGGFAEQPPQRDAAGQAPRLADLPSMIRAATLERRRRRFVARSRGEQGTEAELERAPDRRPSNMAIKATLHSQYLAQYYEDHTPGALRSGPPRAHGHNTRSQTRQAHNAAQPTGGPCAQAAPHEPATNFAELVARAVYKARVGTVKLKDKPDCLCPMAYFQAGLQAESLAICMLRSSHLPDDMYVKTFRFCGQEVTKWYDTIEAKEGVCDACGQHVAHYPRTGDCPKAELQVLLVLHRLLDCTAGCTKAGPNTRPAALAAFCQHLVTAAAPHPQYAGYVAELVHGLEHEGGTVETRERLMRFLVCPTHAGGAPKCLLRALVSIAGAFLWGDVGVADPDQPVDPDQPPAEGGPPMPFCGW